MGGRGARSGMSDKDKEYGSQYSKLLEDGDIKFVTKNTRQSEDLLETMTRNRIYVTIGGKELLRITLFDSINKRNKVIERDKRSGKWHVHHGYEHIEYSKTAHNDLSEEDERLLDRVKEIWKNQK